MSTTFKIPDVTVRLDDRETQTILTALRSVAEHTKGFDFGGAHSKIETANRSPSAPPIEFDVGEDAALLRALQHYRNRRWMRGEIVRLRDLLQDTIGERWEYDVELRDAGRPPQRPLTGVHSHAGPFSKGDLLPQEPSGRCWRVVRVTRSPDSDRPLIVCEPA